jgi:cytochrome o ubiquinol oxidase subunit 3
VSASAKSGKSRHPGINLSHDDDLAHELTEELVFGFWVFLMSDLVLFALLFATYATMLDGKAGGPGPHALFDLKSVAVETGCLLLSSFCFGMASLTMKHDRGRLPLLGWLGITLMLGLAFLGLEIHDFVSMSGNGGPIDRSGFLSAFFALVGTHGLHVLFGSIWIMVMMVQIVVFGVDRKNSRTLASGRRKLADRVQTRILRLGLFWHFLDVVWIGIFSFVYLQGLAR